MKETFAYRRTILEKESPSITKVLDNMPRFRDMPNQHDLHMLIANHTHPGNDSYDEDEEDAYAYDVPIYF